jgi:uncharacterized delta-60 repeat protein
MGAAMNRTLIRGLGLASAAIVLVGCTLIPSARLALVCYDETGALAATFNGGFVIYDIPGSDMETAFAADIAPQAYAGGADDERPWEGSLAVAGDAGSRGERRFLVARFQEDNGNLEDLHFAGDGIVLTDFPGTGSASALALDIGSNSPHVQSRIVVAGKALVGDGHRFAVAVYYWSGGLASDFDGDGRVLTSFPGADDAVARAVAFVPIDDNFRIVVGGDARFAGNRRFAIARYSADGRLDANFDGDGRVITDFPESSTGSIGDLAVVEVGDDLRIVAAGHASSNDHYRIALARYHWDGSLDATFGSGGRVLVDIPGSDSSSAHAVQVDGAGRVLIAGGARDADGDDRFVVARFTADGSLDPDFGSAGFVVTSFPGATGAMAHGMDLDREGRILVAGQAFADGWRFAVARFLPNGSLDPSFDGDGRVLTDLPTHNEMAHDIAYDRRPLTNRLVCAVGQAGG